MGPRNDSGPAAELHLPRGVTRFEYRRAAGFLVRSPAWVEGVRKSVRRLFSDGVYGGKGAAHEAALAFLAECKASLELPPVESPCRKRVPGYGYVRRCRRRYRTSSGELRHYEAFIAYVWDEAGKMRSTNWSVDAHGAERAEAECERWLAAQQASIGNDPEGELRLAG